MINDQMARKSRKHRRKWNDDTLVPIQSDRLRAAMDLGGWTVTRLARRLGKGEHAQTVHHLAQGDGLKRCRGSRRAALAKLLDVTEDWLAGGPYAVPLPAVLPLLSALEGSPRVMLSVGRLFERCYRAVERDLAKETKRPDSALNWNASHDVHWFMTSTLAQFLTTSAWQSAIGCSPPAARTSPAFPRAGEVPEMDKWLGPVSPSAWTAPRSAVVLGPTEEAVILALLHVWMHILEPWLDGVSSLDYKRFRELAAILNPTISVMLPQSWPDRPPVQQLPPAPPTSPYALVDWPLKQASTHSANVGRRKMKGRKT
jgi:hypothetical protein